MIKAKGEVTSEDCSHAEEKDGCFLEGVCNLYVRVSLTLQLYAHSTLETKRSVIEKMDRFL